VIFHYYMEIKRSDALLKFMNVDPIAMSEKTPFKLHNLVDGQWKDTKEYTWVIDPMNGEKIIQMPKTNEAELDEFATSMNKCPKTGLHNPYKNIERYCMYGEICRKAANLMFQPDIVDHFTRIIQRFMPKSYPQAFGEANLVRNFLANFSGDQVRFLAQSIQYPGDYDGQKPTTYRWPFGPVIVISPFNFPLEIPALQMMGALFMGNKVLMKPNSKSTAVMEEFIRMLIYCGMPPSDVDLIHMGGSLFEKIYLKSNIRMTQFTGSSDIAEKLCKTTNGKVKLEDAGFDWKVLGPDVKEIDYVAWQCDQDAYAATGQKCSSQSMLFVHKNWVNAGIYDKLAAIASKRSFDNLTIGPVLSVTNAQFIEQKEKILKMEGAKVLFGGKINENTKIPKCYGTFEPTAMLVPLKHFDNPEFFKILTTEVFGPFQVLTEYDDTSIPKLLDILENIPLHLTAGVVSSEPDFRNLVLGHTVNGVTYAGLRARTTGAPQNHWFGPCGDPRGAGIGTAESIQLVWSCHREIIMDEGPIPKNWKMPPPS